MVDQAQPQPDLVQVRALGLVIYLLHADVPAGRSRHYLGVTRADRLRDRLHEHTHRRGASLTAELARRNSVLILARLWSDASWDLERRLKNQGNHKRLCPVCLKADPSAGLAVLSCPDLKEVEQDPGFIGFPPRPPRARGDPQR